MIHVNSYIVRDRKWNLVGNLLALSNRFNILLKARRQFCIGNLELFLNHQDTFIFYFSFVLLNWDPILSSYSSSSPYFYSSTSRSIGHSAINQWRCQHSKLEKWFLFFVTMLHCIDKWLHRFLGLTLRGNKILQQNLTVWDPKINFIWNRTLGITHSGRTKSCHCVFVP